MNTRVDGRMGITFAAVLVASVTWAGAAEGQQTREILISELPIAEQARVRTEVEEQRAESADLLRQAMEAEKRGEWSEAARLYEESGKLRMDGDLLGGTSYELAGRAYHFNDQPDRASRMWEEAASRALIVGDVLGAARNYMYAAVAAQEKGKRTRAAQLGWKAYRLTESEHITARERALIREHLEVVPETRGP